MLGNRNIKVLEVSRSYLPSIGGLEKFVSDRLLLLNHLNIEYELLTTDYSSGKKTDSKTLNGVTYLRQFSPYNLCFGIKKYIDKTEAEIVSVNQIGNFLSDFSIYLSKKKRKKVILTPHLYFHTNKYEILKRIHKKFVSSKLLSLVDALICFTEFEKQFYIENFHVQAEKIFVITHYYEKRYFTLENKLGDYILYLGRSGINKRLDILIRAYSNLQGYFLKLYLTVDFSELGEELQKLVINNSNIKLLGQISEDEKWRLLFSTRALILPSDYEAFGIVLLEASQAKKAILCSMLPVFKEVLAGEGVIYFNNTVSDLEKILIQFQKLGDKEVLDMGEANYLNLERYSFSRIREQYKSMFAQVLEE